MEANDEAQASGGGRLYRPESSTSSHTRFTPQSSNNSSTNTQHRRQSGIGERERMQDRAQGNRRESLGASLLQERLKEKKVARSSERRQSTDLDVLPDDSGAKSSPQAGAIGRLGRDRERRPSSSGGRPLPLGKKGMGLKEMEEQVSTLHKQNFDLKLELFHRRQRQLELEGRLETAEAQISDQAEMQTVNEQLLAELEKRDQAIEEAVGIICALEERIDELSKGRTLTLTRSYDSQYESNHFLQGHEPDGQSNQDPDFSLQQHDGPGNATSTKPTRPSMVSKSVPKMPSFLSEQSEGTEALRSLYLQSDHHNQSLHNFPKLQEEDTNRGENEEADTMDSPRLSVLSESSFLSVYGDKGLAAEGLDLDDGPDTGSPGQQKHRKSLSIEKWVHERANAANSPPKRPSVPKAPGLRNEFPSILNVLESPLQRLEKMERKLARHHASVRLFNQPTVAKVRSDGRNDKQAERDTTRKTEMTTFGHQQALPPTPDTISTNTLHRFKNSSDTLERSAIEDEQGLGIARHNHTSDTPSYNTASNVRPHSAGETVTSRREGHGWDTVTQSEYTETNSDLDVELSSTFDPWIAMGREKRRSRIQPPDMFTFGSDDEEGWGRDIMFNRHNSRQLPRLKENGYGNYRSEEPRSEDTITGSSRMGESSSTSTRDTIPNPALSNQPSPNPPERRSSLAHSPVAQEKRQRKPSYPVQPSLLYHNAVQATTTTTTYTDQMQNNSKRSRLTSKLFNLGRSDLPPNSSSSGAAIANTTAITAAPNPNAIRNYSDNIPQPRGKRSSIDLGVGIDGLHGSSATPPPIARYPRNRRGVGTGLPRPVSASSLDSNVPSKSLNVPKQRRGYVDGFGVDGAGDERERAGPTAAGNPKGDGKTQVRKGWFGLGRATSLRR